MADTWDYNEWGWWPQGWTDCTATCTTTGTTTTGTTTTGTTTTFTFNPDNIPRLLFRTISEQARQDEKGRELLLSMLTPVQREQMERENRFRVTGSEGGEYLINCTSITGNVHRMDGERIVRHLCAYATGVTVNDIWLSQKLVLEADEPLFHAEAEVMIP